MPRIVVTGCGRAGTQYIARLLAYCNLRVTHEGVFRPDLDASLPPSPTEIEPRWNDPKDPRFKLDVEVSWLAVPFITSSLSEKTVVWHQVRDLRKVVRCWAQHDMASVGTVAQFVQNALPNLPDDPLERAVAYVLKWNTWVEYACWYGNNYYRHKVEDLTPELLQAKLYVSGVPVQLSQTQTAFQEIPPGTGGCPGGHKELNWSQIMKCKHGPALANMARRYGYEVNP